MAPTSVDADAEFEGILSGKDAQILGKFKGEIMVTGKLVIGEGAKVDAKVTADTVEVGGTFKGDLTTRALAILDKGRVDGSVEVKNISMRDGAQLNGAVNVSGAGKPAGPAMPIPPVRGNLTG